MASKLLSSPIIQTTIAGVLASYMSFVKLTTKWEVRHRERAEPAWALESGVLCCFWHGRLLMAYHAWPKKGAQQVSVLVSRSVEGDVIDKTISHHNLLPIRGSSENKTKKKSKGSLKAFRLMLKHVKLGKCVAITPDGPRGPLQRTEPGTLHLARAAGVPIVTLSWATQKRVVMKSWDKFILPLPFGRGVITYGELIHVPRETDDEGLVHYMHLLEDTMTALNDEVDIACGHEPITPAPRAQYRTATEAQNIADANNPDFAEDDDEDEDDAEARV